MIKKFKKGVAILAIAGLLYDRAWKNERLSNFKTILSEGYSNEDIEVIDNLLSEDCCVYYQGTTYIEGSKKLLKRLAIIIAINCNCNIIAPTPEQAIVCKSIHSDTIAFFHQRLHFQHPTSSKCS